MGNAISTYSSYSPSYGSRKPHNIYIFRKYITDNSGNLTLATANLSGSTTQSTDTITSNITFVRPIQNIGSGSVTVNVFTNQTPINIHKPIDQL